MNLSELNIGIKSKVQQFSNTKLGGKLMSMGMLPGSEIQIVRKASSGKTYYIKVNGFCMALRENEAKCILLN